MIATARCWLIGPLFSLLLGFFPADVLVYADEPGTSPQVTISHVRVGLSDHGPVVLLSADGKTIPVFVDHTVAASIQAALTGENLPRPLSHDLMHTILEAFGGRVVRTVITLKAGTYYGSLTVAFQGQEKVSTAGLQTPSPWPFIFTRPFSWGGTCWMRSASLRLSRNPKRCDRVLDAADS